MEAECEKITEKMEYHSLRFFTRMAIFTKDTFENEHKHIIYRVLLLILGWIINKNISLKFTKKGKEKCVSLRKELNMMGHG
jgi:positive regulator of sigma E activity